MPQEHQNAFRIPPLQSGAKLQLDVHSSFKCSGHAYFLRLPKEGGLVMLFTI